MEMNIQLNLHCERERKPPTRTTLSYQRRLFPTDSMPPVYLNQLAPIRSRRSRDTGDRGKCSFHFEKLLGAYPLLTLCYHLSPPTGSHA